MIEYTKIKVVGSMFEGKSFEWHGVNFSQGEVILPSTEVTSSLLMSLKRLGRVVTETYMDYSFSEIKEQLKSSKLYEIRVKTKGP